MEVALSFLVPFVVWFLLLRDEERPRDRLLIALAIAIVIGGLLNGIVWVAS